MPAHSVVTYACWNFKACGLIGMTIALMSKAQRRGRKNAKGESWRWRGVSGGPAEGGVESRDRGTAPATAQADEAREIWDSPLAGGGS